MNIHVKRFYGSRSRNLLLEGAISSHKRSKHVKARLTFAGKPV